MKCVHSIWLHFPRCKTYTNALVARWRYSQRGLIAIILILYNIHTCAVSPVSVCVRERIECSMKSKILSSYSFDSIVRTLIQIDSHSHKHKQRVVKRVKLCVVATNECFGFGVTAVQAAILVSKQISCGTFVLCSS